MVMLSDYVIQIERQCLREVIQGYLDGKDLCSRRAFKLMEMDFFTADKHLSSSFLNVLCFSCMKYSQNTVVHNIYICSISFSIYVRICCLSTLENTLNKYDKVLWVDKVGAFLFH